MSDNSDDMDPVGSPAVAPRERGLHPAAHEGATADVAEYTAFYRESVPRLVAFLRWQGASFPDAVDCVQDR